MPTVQHESWGQIEIQAQDEELLKSSLRGQGVLRQKWRYCWRPNAELAEHVGPTFAIEMDCYLDGQGRRRFTQAGGYRSLIFKAFHAGRAIRCERENLSHEQQVQIEVFWNCYQRVQHLREKLKRKFKTFADLQIRRGGRKHDAVTTVLPEGLGSTPAQPNDRWTLPELTDQGRRRAEQDGISKMTNAVLIQYGLLAAAEQNPLAIADSESEAVIRMALFDIERAIEVSTELVDCLFNRLKKAFGQHENDSSEEFWTWFNGNVFKSLANQAGDTYGKLDLAQVRSAALEIGWRAHHTVARCLATFAEAFVADLPEPLTAEEQTLFAATFYPQAFLGGLPLIMVLDRSELIQPVITRMWDEPDNAELPSVLLRLLQYYGEMVSPRRAADRRTKETVAGNGHLSVEYPQGKARDGSKISGKFEDQIPANGSDPRLAAWQDFLDAQNIECHDPECEEILRLLSHPKLPNGSFVLEIECPRHGALPPRRIPAKSLRSPNPSEEN